MAHGSWLMALALLVLAGCAPTLSESSKTAIRNVAVVSALGDDVALVRIFGDLEPPERLDWQFDRIASEVIADAVRTKYPGASIVPIEHDPNALAAGINKLESFKSFADPARIEPTLRQLASGTTVDTIVLIARGNASQGALIYYEGVGLQTERTFLPRAPVMPYAALALFVIEVPTMRVLAKSETLLKGGIYNIKPLIQFEAPAGPAPFLPGFTFPMNEEQKEFARPLLQDLVRSGTRELVEKAGL